MIRTFPAPNSGDTPRRNEVVSFGAFRLLTEARTLYRGQERVNLGSRALDILIALIERAGEVVSHRELMARVWPNLVVAAANLPVNIATLRKALDDTAGGIRYVVNVPGRGYCFVAPIERSVARASLHEAPLSTATGSASRLPPRLESMVGRDETVDALCELLLLRRFVSVVGAGGVGKTTVTVAAAHNLLDRFDGLVFFVDLSTVANGTLVDSAVAATLGVDCHDGDLFATLLESIAERRILLVFDNCEHVAEAAVDLAERLFRHAPQLYLLTTSREWLRADGEYVHFLLPLEVPPEGRRLTVAAAMTWPAVRLFMERALAAGYRFELTDDDVPVVSRICRRLDGLALTIELAAGWTAKFGIKGTAELLDRRYGFALKGRRVAHPRHQTINALLDWSYNLLPEFEQKVLCRLTVFVGIFCLEAAQAVAAGPGDDRDDIIAAIGHLVAKSLVSVAESGAACFRLLETTRTYGFTKLVDSGEMNQVAQRHAKYCREFLQLPNEALYCHKETPRSFERLKYLGNIRATLE